MHLTIAQAKDLGIEGGEYMGTIRGDDYLTAEPTSAFDEILKRALGSPRKQKKRMATADRLEIERQGTTELVNQLKIVGIKEEPRSLLHPQGQLRFHPVRRWRFDLAFEKVMLAVELQGFGSHTSEAGLTIDTEKACEAAAAGWTVLPVLYQQVRDGRAHRWIEAVYKRLSNLCGLHDECQTR
jgi:very-short-patch-repair endonuclease